MKKDTIKSDKIVKKVVSKKPLEKLDEIVAKKQAEEEIKTEKPIENGTGIVIMLSGDILMGGFLFRKQIAYKINKQQFVDLEKHTRILGVAMQIL